MDLRAVPTIPDDPSSLPLTGPPAILGQPPATQQDYYQIKGLFRMIGVNNMSPMMGFFAAKRPANYKYETRAPSVLAGLIIVILIIVVPTTARLALRLRRTSSMKFGWDDWTIIVAALLALIYPIAQIVGVANGGSGHHAWEVNYNQYSSGMIIATLCKTTFYVAVGFIKLSIAIFIRRLANRLGRGWHLTCDIFIGTIIAYILLAIFFNIFICNPVAIQWDMELRGRLEPLPKCQDLGLQSKILSGIHVAQGMMLLSTPIIILWQVRMHTPKKIRLFVIWGTGAVTVLGGLLRQIRPTLTDDFTWDFTEVLVWTCLDLSCGMLVASLPVLDGLFDIYWRKAKNSLTNTYDRSNTRGTGSNPTWPYTKTSDNGPTRTFGTSTTVVSNVEEQSISSETMFGGHQQDKSSSRGVELNIIKT